MSVVGPDGAAAEQVGLLGQHGGPRGLRSHRCAPWTSTLPALEPGAAWERCARRHDQPCSSLGSSMWSPPGAPCGPLAIGAAGCPSGLPGGSAARGVASAAASTPPRSSQPLQYMRRAWSEAPSAWRSHGAAAGSGGRRRAAGVPAASSRLGSPALRQPLQHAAPSSPAKRCTCQQLDSALPPPRPRQVAPLPPLSACCRWPCPPSLWRPSALTSCRRCTPTWPRTRARRTP